MDYVWNSVDREGASKGWPHGKQMVEYSNTQNIFFFLARLAAWVGVERVVCGIVSWRGRMLVSGVNVVVHARSYSLSRDGRES